jgi:hypothetical protein
MLYFFQEKKEETKEILPSTNVVSVGAHPSYKKN